jgi:hypothetical protein
MLFFPTGRSAVLFEARVHPYSGLDPKSWSGFLESVRLFDRLKGTPDLDGAANALYGSLEHIRNLGLGSDYQEELDAIATELGYDGEQVINANAISKGLYFFPKYLNETIPIKEDVRRVTRLRSDT